MEKDNQTIPASGMMLFVLLLINTIIIKDAYIKNQYFSWLMWFSLPFLLLAMNELRREKNVVIGSLPVIRGIRGFLESVFHKLQEQSNAFGLKFRRKKMFKKYYYPLFQIKNYANRKKRTGAEER